MNVQEEYIVGIYNYCDRWCEACRFTSRCRSFAIETELAAAMDPSMAELTGERSRACGAALPLALGATLEARPLPSCEELSMMMAPDHRPLEALARGYVLRAHPWLQTSGLAVPLLGSDPSNPVELIQRYLLFIPGKVFRALTNWRNPAEDYRHDAIGSAKAALVAVERSHAAWLLIVEKGLAPLAHVEPFLIDLDRISEGLDRIFPTARQFVRPGFDEELLTPKDGSGS